MQPSNPQGTPALTDVERLFLQTHGAAGGGAQAQPGTGAASVPAVPPDTRKTRR